MTVERRPRRQNIIIILLFVSRLFGKHKMMSHPMKGCLSSVGFHSSLRSLLSSFHICVKHFHHTLSIRDDSSLYLTTLIPTSNVHHCTP